MTYQRTENEIIDEDLGLLIYRSPNSPNWYLQYQDPARGQQRRSLRVKSTKRARSLAKQEAAKIRLNQHNPGPARMPRIDDMAERHLEFLKLNGKKPKSLAVYGRTYRQLIWFAAQRRIHHLPRINAELLEAFQQTLAEPGIPVPDVHGEVNKPPKPAKPKTIYDKLKHVRSLVGWAVKRKHLSQNPLAGYELPEKPKSRGYCYTAEEVRRICKAAEPPFADIFQFLALTGLRIDELLWLTTRDICLKRRVVLVQDKEIPETGESWQVLKQGDGRAVPLCEAAVEIATRAIERTHGPWLFPTPEGERWAYNRLGQVLDTTKTAAGVTKGRFHAFRHAYCSWLANRGVSPFQVMKLMGHSSLELVLTYYSVSDDELARSVTSANLHELLTTDGGSGNNREETKPQSNQTSGNPVAAEAAAGA